MRPVIMVNKPLTIRREGSRDADDVRLVHQRAFGRPSEAALVDALRGVAGAVSLVAIVDRRVVGHILFTPVQLAVPLVIKNAEPAHAVEPAAAVKDVSAMGLAPMAVLPEYQRQNIGSRLVRAGLDACHARRHDLVVVLGHPAFYPRFGFVPAHTRGLTCEYPVPPEVFMVLDLRSDAPRPLTALVRYRPEFANH